MKVNGALLTALLALAGCDVLDPPPPAPRRKPIPPAGVLTGVPRPTAVTPAKAAAPHADSYHWPQRFTDGPTIGTFIEPPKGAKRVPVAAGSYGAWLRSLPMRPGRVAVMGYDGREVLDATDPRLAGVVDLDLIGGDLQQCADSILRLRAEYLWAAKQQDQIAFQYTSGFNSKWSDWKAGRRPQVKGRSVTKKGGFKRSGSRRAFEGYLRNLFTYAGTLSLAREASKPASRDVAVGDFFIQGGSPGHAVLIVDLAKGKDGTLYALLGQGFMPAQDFHIVRPHEEATWFRLTPGKSVRTPMWKPFPWSSRRRLKGGG